MNTIMRVRQIKRERWRDLQVRVKAAAKRIDEKPEEAPFYALGTIVFVLGIIVIGDLILQAIFH